jgi:hypothetical protein
MSMPNSFEPASQLNYRLRADPCQHITLGVQTNRSHRQPNPPLTSSDTHPTPSPSQSS